MAASAVRRAVALWVLALACAACRQSHRVEERVRDWPRGELRSGGGPVLAALRVGEVHRYRLPLAKGTLLRLVVDQQGIDAKVALVDPTGAPALEADRLIGDGGPELVLAVAQRTGVHTLIVSGGDYGPGRYAARIETLRPATQADRRSAEAYRIFLGAENLPPQEAMASWTRALATWKDLGETGLEAEARARIARQHYDRGEYPSAAGLYREAAAGFARAGDHRWEAIARANLGAVLLPMAEPQEAAREDTIALSLARGEKDRITEAQALHGLGQAAQDQGDLQIAFDRYTEALALFRPNDRNLRPFALHNLGVLYARQLGDERRGRELLVQARDAWLPPWYKWKARTLSQLGWLASRQGRLDEARGNFEAALALDRKSDPCGSAMLLARLALVEDARKARPAADARLAEALRILASKPCLRSAPTVHLLAGELAEGRGDGAAAQAAYRRSEALFATQGDRLGTVDVLGGLARNARSLGDLPAALAASRQSLDIIEGVRPTVLREDLRTSFFAAARDRFDFHVDLLMRMGREEEGWATAERSRARALRDLLAEAGAGLRRDVPPDLAGRERELLRQLNALESRRLATGDSPEKLRKYQANIAERMADLESLHAELRRRSPLWASLARTDPVSLDDVRRELLDDDTVLLEYRLGEPESTVWAVTRDSFTAARLPPRREIEPLALEAAARLRRLEWPGHNPPALCELSRMLLAPVAPALAHRRLVIVADGALEVLPFAALPEPADAASCAGAPVLVDRHEIAYLPSATTLLTQRRLRTGRQPPPGWLAVVDDPVYGPGDSRLGAPRPQTAAVARGGAAPHRLPGSGEEAAAILAGLPTARTFRATGFAASRQMVAGGALRGFRILHFATHGILNDRQPLLSSLALSRLDAAGRPVAGDLTAVEIYDLDLPAELVTLSACETALGREVPGEGLVSGLPRAFLYAGAARVVVSLWPVEDRATRDLMTHFYRGLFAQGLAPARALQEAQRILRQAGRPPHQWAGFVLLGDWRPLQPFSN
jgi:CHAT domain-containing protein/Tfp pilus assembly protein PilF